MKINDIVKSFSTTPFLFLGSGITRRYFGLPDWNGLLEHFAKEVRGDDFAYSYYLNKAEKENSETGLMPKVAALIQNDYDEMWFKNEEIRHVKGEELNAIKEARVSPFKAEIAHYIKSHSILNPEYSEEVKAFKNLSQNHISGIITTNYDTFIEDSFIGYTKYIGQEQLIFSPIQGIAEIYKIHGSVELPDSIVINDKDYEVFESKCDYLAAKIMTIFLEYPIIFMGYSISDKNIQGILNSIVNCLNDVQLRKLENRFVFVEYAEGKIGAEINPHTIMVNNKPLTMKRIVLSDFKLIYEALTEKRLALPARVLRMFRQELYDYTITNQTTSKLRVASIDDQRVKDEELVMAIGKYSDFGLKGLKGLTAAEWYKNIIIPTINYSPDELLKYSFPGLMAQNSNKLPFFKYLRAAKQSHPECEEQAKVQNFDTIISETIKKNRSRIDGYTHSVKDIWNSVKDTSIGKAADLIAHLREDEIDVEELESVLQEIFQDIPDILETKYNGSVRTNVKRLIRIYDYLKWGKEKELLN